MLRVRCPDGRDAEAEGSKLRFSTKEDRSIFHPDDVVYLSPGDGERINGLGQAGDYIIALKPSTVFVFYGVSDDATGRPIFNYRVVARP